jgi:hypothetical protein
LVAQRQLGTPAVDPDDHHLYASLGCAAENLVIARQRAVSMARCGSSRQATVR